MFAKSKSSSSAPSVLQSNPLQNLYEIGKQTATAGPENLWRIYDGYKKSDMKEVSIFLFEKRSADKLYKPKRKETVTEILREGVIYQMERFSHPKLLQVYKVEECAETLAFASEPVLASLANVLAYQEQRANSIGLSSNTAAKQTSSTTSHRPTFTKEYDLLDIEIKYGLLQITEALYYLHEQHKVLHRNVCPTSIVITKRGTWKLSGFEFAESTNEATIPIQQWTNRMPKMTQPNLDYIAPEIQLQKCGGFYSDMYSFGMTICAIFNQGRALIQANHNASEYAKQWEGLEKQVQLIIPLIPMPLREAVTRLLLEKPLNRLIALSVMQLKYFQDPIVHALQFLDVRKMKDLKQKEHFYTTTLKESLPYIPKKLWYQHVWAHLQEEMETKEVLSAVLQPMLHIVEKSTQEEYEQIVFPTLCRLFYKQKSIQGTVTLLENLHLILSKTHRNYIETEVLPMLYLSFDHSNTQIQTAAFVAVSKITEDIEDDAIRDIVLPKLLQAFEKNSVDPRILIKVIPCILQRLEKQKIIDCILPLLFNVKLDEPEIVERVVEIYALMLSDKKYGLSINLMATRAMPSLLPQTINPALNLNQFQMLFQVLQEMLSHIERNQKNKLTLDNVHKPSLERLRPLRHQYSTENMYVAPFNIPNLRVERRKTSSAEDMARKNSSGSISMTASAENMTRKNSMVALISGLFTSSSTNDGNFLRVANTFTTRRLSDNTLKIQVAPSCASSPGGATGGDLPIRRHSSFGPQERPGSSSNLSLPTDRDMPITSRSVPFLLTTSMNSLRSSRTPSVSSTSYQPASGFLHQVGSSMQQLFNRQSDA